MKRIALALLATASVATATPAAAQVYVGSWLVDSGPTWTSNPPVYSGQEAAALLFGGAPSDYVISTMGTDPALINSMAYYDGWADDYTCGTAGPCAQNMHSDLAPAGYNDPGGYQTAYSAYVSDHELHLQNFAFKIDGAVPEPATWAMMLLGFGGIAVAMRRRNTALPQLA